MHGLDKRSGVILFDHLFCIYLECQRQLSTQVRLGVQSNTAVAVIRFA
jgi:hypothetical protein